MILEKARNMRTDLNHDASSLFKKSRTVVDQIESKEIEKSANTDYTDIDELIERANKAIADRDEDQLRWLQFEIHARTLIFLKMIDWKMWEVYNKFIR